jgi:hypothetical protein
MMNAECPGVNGFRHSEFLTRHPTTKLPSSFFVTVCKAAPSAGQQVRREEPSSSASNV